MVSTSFIYVLKCGTKIREKNRSCCFPIENLLPRRDKIVMTHYLIIKTTQVFRVLSVVLPLLLGQVTEILETETGEEYGKGNEIEISFRCCCCALCLCLGFVLKIHSSLWSAADLDLRSFRKPLQQTC